MMRIGPALAATVVLLAPALCIPATTEFCLEGEFNLGARFQGMSPRSNEFYPARWCVITEDTSERVLLIMHGRSNPDMDGSWSVAFVPPDLVRIVNADSPPDVEFRTTKSVGEALRTRRMDPRRVVEELAGGKAGGDGFSAVIVDGELLSVETTADLPLRGRVPVIWRWGWASPEAPMLTIHVGDDMFFRAVGSWRVINADEAAALWRPTPGADPVAVPGDRWPARVDMELDNLTDGVHLVQTVRTGFQHLVVETDDGLVIADAPAGWVEIHQIPPEDLVPGLGISGLSEKLIDFLAEEFPDKAIRAVALTHHHDDHAGGARAFAAAGANIFAPAELTEFLRAALGGDSMPPDRLSALAGTIRIAPVVDYFTLSDSTRPVRLLNMGRSPHTGSSLGVLASGYFFQSDLHVPRNESDSPRPDRATTECWFAAWSVANLPPETVVVNTHSPVQTPVARLATYLESDVCLDAALEP